jgi:chromosome segregation ATPase
MRYDEEDDAFERFLSQIKKLAGELALSEERNGELRDEIKKITTGDSASANSWEGRYTNLEAALKFERQKVAALHDEQLVLETDLEKAQNTIDDYWTRIKKLEDEVKELRKPKAKPRPKTKRKR